MSSYIVFNLPKELNISSFPPKCHVEASVIPQFIGNKVILRANPVALVPIMTGDRSQTY
jgi:hypothetical protein